MWNRANGTYELKDDPKYFKLKTYHFDADSSQRSFSGILKYTVDQQFLIRKFKGLKNKSNSKRESKTKLPTIRHRPTARRSQMPSINRQYEIKDQQR